MRVQVNVRVPEETRQQIAAIRARFGLQSDAQAVIYAVNELAQEIAPPAPFNPDTFKIVEDEVFAFHGQQGAVIKSPASAGVYPSIPGQPERLPINAVIGGDWNASGEGNIVQPSEPTYCKQHRIMLCKTCK